MCLLARYGLSVLDDSDVGADGNAGSVCGSDVGGNGDSGGDDVGGDDVGN